MERTPELVTELSNQRLDKLHGLHRGDRCFVVGTGPSLQETDFSLIKNEIIFGVNGLYKGFDDFGIKCKYYGIADDLVIRAHGDVMGVDAMMFLGSSATGLYIGKPFLHHPIPIVMKHLKRNIPKQGAAFSMNPKKGTYWGGTVIYDICLQVCRWMGFSEVILLGCDCDYSGMHHFDGSKAHRKCEGAVGKWHNVFACYKRAKEVYEAEGKKILNATVGGKLEIFPRVKLEEL